MGSMPRGCTQVLIVFNPVSGSGNHRIVDVVQQALSNRGCDISLYLTQSAGDAPRDGTINEVVNGLRGWDNQRYRLALIPAGTVNALAAEPGIDKTPEDIVDTIAAGV